jgi:hypothetical protein
MKMTTEDQELITEDLPVTSKLVTCSFHEFGDMLNELESTGWNVQSVEPIKPSGYKIRCYKKLTGKILTTNFECNN